MSPHLRNLLEELKLRGRTLLFIKVRLGYSRARIFILKLVSGFLDYGKIYKE